MYFPYLGAIYSVTPQRDDERYKSFAGVLRDCCFLTSLIQDSHTCNALGAHSSQIDRNLRTGKGALSLISKARGCALYILLFIHLRAYQYTDDHRIRVVECVQMDVLGLLVFSSMGTVNRVWDLQNARQSSPLV